ncbi:MAG: hemolysin secretion protein D, partial [Desulfobacca sp.]|nr:hemolysin secretion protein D [Desulfobacca sp.]
MKKKIIILAILAIIGVAVWTFYFKNRQPPDLNTVRVSGNIEITDVAVSFKIPGRVEKRMVSEGEMVKAGQVVARLDNQDLSQEVA